MSTWFKLLSLELADIKTLKEPMTPVEPSDHQIGTISDELKALHTLSVMLKRESEKRELDAKYAENEEVKKALTSEACELRVKAITLSQIFVVGLCEDFGCWDKPYIALRKGFVAVWIDPPTSPFPMFFQQT